jgi:hypothetical protein
MSNRLLWCEVSRSCTYRALTKEISKRSYFISISSVCRRIRETGDGAAKELNSGDPHTQSAVFLSTLTGNIKAYKMES